MSSIFEAYDAEFTAISKEINKNINGLKNDCDGDEYKASTLIKQIEALLSQSSDLIKQMEVELRGHDPATRKVLTDKVGHYKKSIISLKTDFERGKEKAQRSSLIGNKSIEHRQRLLDVNDRSGLMFTDLILTSTMTLFLCLSFDRLV
jgi:hypothetical protein